MIIWNSKIFVNPETKPKLEKQIQRVQLILDSRIVIDMSKYTPWGSGELEESAHNHLGSGIITNRKPYARKQYKGIGFNYNKSHNPQASHHWFEKAKVINKPIWLKLVQVELDKPSIG
jgi:hypothetical protein